MLQFLSVVDDNTIAIRASGKLTHEDYQSFLPKLEEKIKTLGKASILLELDNFSGWELQAAKDDFSFGMKHLDDIERFAVVGDKAWERWMVLMAKPFLSAKKLRYFDHESLQVAWDWLREPQKIKESIEQLQPYKKIIVAYDFSPYSKHAVQRAIELATLYQAKLTLLNVVHEITPYPTYYGDAMLSYGYDNEVIVNQNKDLRTEAKQQMEGYISRLNTDLDINFEVLSGDIKATILSYLEAQNTDLVIFGTKKRSFSQLLGSVPRFIQNHARCEVLTIPLQEKIEFLDK